MPHIDDAYLTHDGLVLDISGHDVEISRDDFGHLEHALEKISDSWLGKFAWDLVGGDVELKVNGHKIYLEPDQIRIPTDFGQDIVLNSDTQDRVERLLDGPLGDTLIDLVNDQLGHYGGPGEPEGTPLTDAQTANDVLALTVVDQANQINSQAHSLVDGVPLLGNTGGTALDAANQGFGQVVAQVLNLANGIAGSIPAALNGAQALLAEEQAVASDLAIVAGIG